MNLPKSKLDITSFTAEECNVSREKVRFVIREFEKNLKLRLRNPGISGLFIRISRFCEFQLKTYLVEDRLERGHNIKKDLQIIKYLEKDEGENKNATDNG